MLKPGTTSVLSENTRAIKVTCPVFSQALIESLAGGRQQARVHRGVGDGDSDRHGGGLGMEAAKLSIFRLLQ